MKTTILIYGSLILACLLLLQIGQYALVFGQTRIEFVLALTAGLFLLLGLYLQRERAIPVQANTDIAAYEIDQGTIAKLKISPREYEVLEKIADGLSNREIATALFLSESTIKTHVSNLLQKLDAKRRTQAVKRAKSLKIL